jgi:hypothetical protein
MSAETWKILGLIVGSVGTIVAAVAKVMDEREKSRASLAAHPPSDADRSTGSQIPSATKRSLYVSIAALSVAVFGFVVGFLGELAAQRQASDAATKQAVITQKMLVGVTRTITRLQSISVKLYMAINLDLQRDADFRQKLEKTLDEFGEDGFPMGHLENGFRKIANNGYSYKFSFGGDYTIPTHTGSVTGKSVIQTSICRVSIGRQADASDLAQTSTALSWSFDSTQTLRTGVSPVRRFGTPHIALASI